MNQAPHILISQSLTARKPSDNPWVDLFESDASPMALLDLLATQAIPIENKETAAALRDAFVRRMLHTETLRYTKEAMAILSQAEAFPGTLTEKWPVPNKNKQQEAVILIDKANQHIMGRLVAAAGGIGNTLPNALSVALKAHWTRVVRQILKHFTPENTLLEQLKNENGWRGKRDALPWLHELADSKRLAELTDWIAVPGFNPNFTCVQGTTALFHAQDVATVEALIKAGIDPTIQANNGTTAQVAWGIKQNSHTFSEDTLKAMVERLADAFSNPQEKIEADALHVLNQWLHHDSLWKKYTGPDLGSLSEELKETLGTLSIKMTTKKEVHEWGVGAYIGMKIPTFNNLDPLKWKPFIDDLPEAWLTHESADGIMDGWILATGILNLAIHKSDNEENTNNVVSLFKQLEKRLMSKVKPEQHQAHRLNAIIRACDASLSQVELPRDKLRVGQLLHNLARMDVNAHICGILPVNMEILTPHFITGVTLPRASEYLLKYPVLLQKATPFLAAHLNEESTRQAFWDSLLQEYSKTVTAQEKKTDNKMLNDKVKALTTAMETLIKAHLIPGHFKTSGVKLALKKLKTKDPEIFSHIQATLLTKALPDHHDKGRPRVRM